MIKNYLKKINESDLFDILETFSNKIIIGAI